MSKKKTRKTSKKRAPGRPATGTVHDIRITLPVNAAWLKLIGEACGESRARWIRDTCERAAKRQIRRLGKH